MMTWADNEDPRLPDDDPDADEPVAELATLTEDPSPGFFGRILRSVERRRLSSDMAEMSFSGLVMVFLEYLGTWFGIVEETGRKDQGDGDE